MAVEKSQIIAALYAFVAQRSGIEFCNYGDVKAFRAEQRSITKDGQQARRLIRDVELRDSITAEDILAATRAFSGRLQLKQTDKGVRIEYCTGQYFPTEYRRAVCAVMASALWDWKRTKAMPKGELVHNSETGETFGRYNGLRAGDWLRKSFRKEYGRAIASRWFD